jgi:hypothetical protein
VAVISNLESQADHAAGLVLDGTLPRTLVRSSTSKSSRPIRRNTTLTSSSFSQDLYTVDRELPNAIAALSTRESR